MRQARRNIHHDKPKSRCSSFIQAVDVMTLIAIIIIIVSLGFFAIAYYFLLNNDNGSGFKLNSDIASKNLSLRDGAKHEVSSTSIIRIEGEAELNHAVIDAHPAGAGAGSINKIEGENNFLLTLKSCDPANNLLSESQNPKTKQKQRCHPVNNGSSRSTHPHRIGIITPPGNIGKMFASLIQNSVAASELLQEHNIYVEIFHTSSVPPYGYGKNHGWQKIIRLVTTPLTLGIVDALLFFSSASSVNGHGQPTSKVDPSTLDGGRVMEDVLRQILRWQCRLSHVSAHTELQTVHLSDFMLDPSMGLSNIEHFLFETMGSNHDNNRDSLMVAKKEDLEKLRQTVSIAETTYQVLLQDTKGTAVTTGLGRVIQEELGDTNQFQDWPCPSLWEVGTDMQMQGGRTTNPWLSKVATAMAPDCEDAFTKCTIKIDLCKEAVDQSMCSK